MNTSISGLDIVLVHHPVVNTTGEIIGSAVTNLDIHDIARAGRTYGVDNYYIVTPYEDQQTLVTEILNHWITGHGASRNPARKEALELVRLADSLDTVIKLITKKRNQAPQLIGTSAKVQEKTLSYGDVRAKINAKEAILLIFGTAHGLAPQVMEMTNYCLPPVGANTGYNHLSVRSAVSIILDRLLSA
jgi:hypothetical protein